jgi:hypothetical protein
MARIQLKARTGIAALTFAALAMPLPAAADAFVFSTGNPDGLMATATRPESRFHRSPDLDTRSIFGARLAADRH